MELDEREFRRLVKLVEENNKLLHKMRRHAVASTILRVVYFGLIIGLAVGSYIFLQPFVEAGRENAQSIFDSLRNIRDVAGNLNGLGGFDIEGLLERARSAGQ